MVLHCEKSSILPIIRDNFALRERIWTNPVAGGYRIHPSRQMVLLILLKETRHGHALKPADRSQHFLRYIIVLWCPGMGSHNIFEIFDVLVGFVVKCRYHLICQSSKTDKI